jgi:RimJ/RimL family protein N-acetyltransferase
MIRFNQFRKAHYSRLISWVDSAETLMQFAGPRYEYPLTEEQLDKSLNDSNRIAFYISESETGLCIGHAEILLTRNSARLGSILIGDKLLRGKGFGQAIVLKLLEYCFNQLDQTQTELNVFDWNIIAIKCYEKAGFTINPEKTSEREVNGKKWIALNMVIDKETWLKNNTDKN